jgi:NIMA (never in mitosis gene a)-related kinase
MAKNVFLTTKNYVKLGDFGIAKTLNNTREKARTIIGTPYYLSPEIVQNRPYGFESDIWSLGVLLYEMCALKPPFNAYSISALAMKISGGVYNQIPGQYSRELRVLIGSMLSLDPHRRPSIHKILRNPFIQSRIKTFMSLSLYNLNLSNSINKKKKIEQNESEHERVQKYWDKLREKSNASKNKPTSKSSNAKPKSIITKPIESLNKDNEQVKENNDKNIQKVHEETKRNYPLMNTPSIQEQVKSIQRNIKDLPAKLQKQLHNQDKLPLVQSKFKVKPPLPTKAPANTKPIQESSKEKIPGRQLAKIRSKQEMNTPQGIKHVFLKKAVLPPLAPDKERQERISKREEECKKMREEIMKLRQQNKRSEVCFSLIQRTNSNDTTKTEVIETPKLSPVEVLTKAPEVQSRAESNRSCKKKHSRKSSIRDEIKRLRQQRNDSKGNERVTLANFKECDVLVAGKRVEEQVKQLTKSIAESLKSQRDNEQHQEDIINMLEDMKKVLNNREEEKIELPVSQNMSESCYMDREDLSPLCALPQIESKKEAASQFENIESIVYHLETEYGFDNFKKIYQALKSTEEEEDNELMVKEYLKRLNGIVDKDKILKDLYLFISSKRIEEQASIY